jgi:serine/threonine protein kinase
MTAMHPEPAILALYAAGRLREEGMARLEEHLLDCPVCLAVLEKLPEDTTVRLLRETRFRIVDSSVESPSREPARERVPDPVLELGAPQPSAPLDDNPRLPIKPTRGADGHEPQAAAEQVRYRVERLLGRGGMGRAYLAHDQLEGTRVVLKLLREDLVPHQRVVERFRREATAAAHLKHPNIVQVRGIEQLGRWPAIVMEYIQGKDLSRLVRQRGPIPVSAACTFVHQTAIGLQYSFEQGMVHRDIKPSNLMVSFDGTVKILDFGLAKMQSELHTDPGLTTTGAFLGTVDFMSPEQADDPRVADIRSDIYSLGCTFHYLLSGGPPFQGSMLEVLDAHQSMDAPLVNALRPDVPDELARLVAGMMAKDPAQRPQTPDEVAFALAPLLTD